MQLIVNFVLCWIVLATTSRQTCAAGRASCAEVRREFTMQRIGASRLVPSVPRKPGNLQVCPTDRMTCCTPAMERRYLETSRDSLSTVLGRKFRTLKFQFSSFIRSFQDDLDAVMKRSKRAGIDKLSVVFPKSSERAIVATTVESLVDSIVIAEDQLNRIAMSDEIDSALNRTLGVLFALSYQRTRSEDLSSDKFGCVSSHYASSQDLKQFSLSAKQRIFKSINDTITFYQAVKSGLDAVKRAEKSVDVPECREGILKMRYCSHCYGLTLIKPCLGLCQNVIRGCLVGMSEMDLFWKQYISALIETSRRMSEDDSDLESCLTNVIGEMSSAVGRQLSEETLRSIGKSCGVKKIEKRSLGKSSSKRAKSGKSSRGFRRRRGRRNRSHRNIASVRPRKVLTAATSRSSGPRNRIRPPFEVLRDSSMPISPAITKVSKNPKETADEVEIDEVNVFDRRLNLDLGAKMLRFVNRLNLSLTLYETLPDELCDGDNGFSVVEHGSCWNGANIVKRYSEPVASKGLEGQLSNPEVKVNHIDPNAQNAVENLRISSKILLLRNGYDSIPPALLHQPYFVSHNDSSAPCDDEDDCPSEGSGEASGSGPEPEKSPETVTIVAGDRASSAAPSAIPRFRTNHSKTTTTTTTTTTTVAITERTSTGDLNFDAVNQLLRGSQFKRQKQDALPITVEVVTKTTTTPSGGGTTSVFDRNAWLRVTVLITSVALLRNYFLFV